MQRNQNRWLKPVSVVGLLIVAAVAFFTYERWQPWVVARWSAVASGGNPTDDHQHDDHDHDHEPGSGGQMASPDSVKLTPQAWKNLGLQTGEVTTSDYARTVSVPAVVVERPGRSQVQIPAPLTGIVTKVYPMEREAVTPGQPLFELRLTHEDVVSAQSEFLAALQKLDVIDRELERLKGIGEGVIPGKRIIELQYRRDEALTSIQAFRQSLLLHGLTDQQIDAIEQTRTLLRELTVVAPPFAETDDHIHAEHVYHVQEISVSRGQSVRAGDVLGVLADHCLLFVEGQAFEDDSQALIEAAKNGDTITAIPVGGNVQGEDELSLPVQSVADRVELDSRALKFYLLLPNEMTIEPGDEGRRFVAWKYRPGQRMEARIPTGDSFRDKVVLPAAAVAFDGPNAFVFEQNGDHFDRVDVQVLYRDSDVVVLEPDQRLLGSVIALNGAYELNQALKNQSGGAIDPHHGHSH